MYFSWNWLTSWCWLSYSTDEVIQRLTSIRLEVLPWASLGHRLKMDLSHVLFLALRKKEKRNSKTSNLFSKDVMWKDWETVTPAVKRLRNSHIPRRKERSDLGARGTMVLRVPSLSSIFLHFNKSFLKIVPLTKEWLPWQECQTLWYASRDDTRRKTYLYRSHFFSLNRPSLLLCITHKFSFMLGQLLPGCWNNHVQI